MIKKLCLDILNKFKNLNSDFGKELYLNVEKATNEFTVNLDFNSLKGKLDICYLDYLVTTYCKKNKNVFILTVWPVTNGGEEIFLKHYGKYGNLIYRKDIWLKKNGFKNCLYFVSDKKNHHKGTDLWFAKPYSNKNPLRIYAFEIKKCNDSESKQVEYLKKFYSTKKINIMNGKGGNILRNFFVTTYCKKNCRYELSDKGYIKKVLNERPPFEYSHHVNDEHWETIELCNLFFNNNSIFALNYGVVNFKCASFLNKYPRYKKWINNNPFGDSEDYCLNNSSVLAQYGIRPSRDIDYLHNEKFKINKQKPEDEISSHNYVVKSVDSNIKIDDMVYNPKKYFWFRNIKFVTLKTLLKFKAIQSKGKTKGKTKKDHDSIIEFYKKNNIKLNNE